MTKVRDLIKNTSWSNSEGFYDYNPDITVVLPTYKRGDNGLFKDCVDSILSQTFKNFELIIIDDESFDSTQEKIKSYMANDKRIGCIRHEKNVGLPAISCNEAILKARGQKIFFAFDDNVFKADAFEKLYEFHKLNSEVKVCYGYVNWSISKTKTELLGKEPFNYENLVKGHFIIPNGGVLIDKDVFYEVGLYDPHIANTKFCDWDLWRRIGKKYKFHQLDILVSDEKGGALDDSIGNSYPYDFDLVKEWVELYRDDLLLPKNFMDYSVSFKPNALSSVSKLKIDNLLREKRYNKFLKATADNDDGYWLIISETPEVLALYYNLSDELKKKIRILETFSDAHADFNLILNASGIIYAGSFSAEIKQHLKTLKHVGIPIFYYADGNHCNYEQLFKTFNRSVLKKMDGIFVTKKEKLSDFQKLNQKSVYIPDFILTKQPKENIEQINQVLNIAFKNGKNSSPIEFDTRLKRYFKLTANTFQKYDIQYLTKIFKLTMRFYLNKMLSFNIFKEAKKHSA